MYGRFLAAVAAGSLLVVPLAHAKVLCSNKKGALFVRDACKAKETAADPAALGLTGPQGLQGPSGPPGSAGAPGAAGLPGAAGPGAKWLLVDKDGTILDQSGGLSVQLVGTANYIIDFGESIADKVLQVSNAITEADNTFNGAPLVARCGGGATGVICNNDSDDDRHALVITASWVTNQGPPVSAEFIQARHTFFVAAF
jgi:hypothetical protein